MFSASRTGSSRSVSDPYFENVSLLLKDTGTNGAQNNTFVADPVVAPAGVGYLAGQFNGSSNLALPSNTTLDMASGDFTIEFWLFPNSVSGSAHLIAQQAQDFTIQFGNTLGDQLLVYDGANRVIGSVTAKTWTHVAIVRSGGVLQGYLNGVATGSSWSNTSSTKFSFSSAIIAARWGAANYYNGYISNVRIVKGTAVYTSNFTVPTSPLTAISGTSLLTCQSGSGATFADNSPNNFAITVTGTPTMTGVATAPPGAVPYAGLFNGTSQYLSYSPGSSVAFGTGDFTIEGWFNLNNVNNAPFYFFDARNSSQTSNWAFYRPSANTINWYTGAAEYTVGSFTANSTWVHIAAARSGTSLKVFVNGVQLGSTITDSTNYSTSPTTSYIGCRYSLNEFISGYVSNFRIVKGTAVYTSNFAPPSAPLTAITGTSVLTCQSATFVDNSSNAYTLTNTGSTPVVSSYILPTITRNGTPTQGSMTPYWPDGQWSNYFPGSGSYLTVPRNSALLPEANTDFTAEAWVYLTATPGATQSCILGFGEYGLDADWNVSINSNRTVTFYVHSITTLFTTTLTVPLNAWSHVAVSRSGTGTNNLKVFIDGVGASFSSNATLVGNGNRNLTIAADQNGDESIFNGYISNLRFVNGTGVYTSNFTPSTTPLTAVSGTSLLTCQSNRFKDNSSNNFAITVTGTPTVQAFDPFSPAASYATTIGGSGYFNGGTSGLSIPSNSAYTLGTADFTIEVWIYATVAPSGTAYTVIRQRSNGSLAWNLQIQSGTMYFCYGSSITAYGAVKVGVWEHYAAVKLNGSMYLYKDGVLVTTIANNFNFSATDGVMVGIGGDSSDTAYPFTGYIANARVVKGTAIYTAAFTPPSTPVTGTPNTSLLLNFTNAGIYDAATLNDLVTVGDAKVSTAVAKFGSSSMAFDGTGDYLSTPTSPSMNFGTGDFTVEAWVYPTALSSDWFISSASGSGGFFFGFSSTTIVGYGWGRAGVAWDYRVASTATANTWQHVAVTRSGTSMRLFVNGVQQGTTQTISTAYNMGTTSTTIGSQGANYYLNGYLDDLRVTNGIARYTANFTPPQSLQTR